MKNIGKLFVLALLVGLPISGFRSPKTAEVKKTEIAEKKVEDFIEIGLTYYNPVVSQCDADPLVTASMSKIDTNRTTELHWCAISFDMHVRYGGFLKFGDTITLEYTRGNKIIEAKYIVKDLMNPKLKKRVDILCAIGDCGIPRENVKLKHFNLGKHKRYLAEAEEKKIQEEQLNELSCLLSEKFNFESEINVKSDFYYKKNIPNKFEKGV